MIGRVEHAAMYNRPLPFLDYQNLNKAGLASYCKGVVMEIRRHFYETTTAKSPIQVIYKKEIFLNSSRTSCTKKCNNLISFNYHLVTTSFEMPIICDISF